MFQNRKTACTRRGLTTVQLCVMLAVITLGVIAAVKSLGSNSSSKLTTTASDIANPANLPSRFGS